MENWLIEFADNEQKTVTTAELEAMETEAMKFDGFYSWVVIRKVSNKQDKNIENENNI